MSRFIRNADVQRIEDLNLATTETIKFSTAFGRDAALKSKFNEQTKREKKKGFKQQGWR